MKKKIYVTPAIETVSIAIEQGIAQSGPQNTSSHDGFGTSSDEGTWN